MALCIRTWVLFHYQYFLYYIFLFTNSLPNKTYTTMLITAEVIEQINLGVCPFCGFDYSSECSYTVQGNAISKVRCHCGHSWNEYNKLDAQGNIIAVRTIEEVKHNPIVFECDGKQQNGDIEMRLPQREIIESSRATIKDGRMPRLLGFIENKKLRHHLVKLRRFYRNNNCFGV